MACGRKTERERERSSSSSCCCCSPVQQTEERSSSQFHHQYHQYHHHHHYHHHLTSNFHACTAQTFCKIFTSQNLSVSGIIHPQSQLLHFPSITLSPCLSTSSSASLTFNSNYNNNNNNNNNLTYKIKTNFDLVWQTEIFVTKSQILH